MRVLKQFLLWRLGLAAPATQTGEEERASLERHAAGRKRLAEIGVFQGVTTCRLRRVMAPDGILLAVDPFPPGRLRFSYDRRIARREVSQIGNGQVHWLRQTGVESARAPILKSLGGVDFVFIDANHSYEGLRGDWEGWSPWVVPGGILALHDSCSSPSHNIGNAGSVRFTREVILQDPRFEVIETVDTLTVLRRRGDDLAGAGSENSPLRSSSR
jgi:predicted O-methyltransferase YrrM